MTIDRHVQQVSDSMRQEILKVLGLPRTQGWQGLCSLAFGKATRQLAEVGLKFDRMIAESGLRNAAEWSLTNWCRDILSRGGGNIPEKGPLLVVSNHPGAYDALVIAARIPRPDLHIVASDLPFFRSLENFSRRIFFIPFNTADANGRMAGMLSAVRYLKQGGSVLLMGSGTIDPDPAVFPGASQNLQRWTEAVSVFLRFVPQASILLTAVSHILHPRWARSPLTWFWRPGMERRRVAEFSQVIHQLFHPGRTFVSPRLSFAPLLTLRDLGSSPREALLEQEFNLLIDHCRQFGGNPV